MSGIQAPVRSYMRSAVHTVDPDAPLTNVRDRLIANDVSSLAVVDHRGKLVGVISRTDLLSAFRHDFEAEAGQPLLHIPTWPGADAMTRGPITVSPDDTVAHAAACMVKESIHRVFVVEDGNLVGVFSSRDIVEAIRDAHVRAPLADYLTVPLFTVGVGERIGEITQLLERAGISGMLVTDYGWPVGVFTQREALLASDLERDTLIDVVMTPRVLCLPWTIPIHRAAAHAAAMNVRRVVAMDEQTPHGITTGLDFARAAVQA